METVNTFVIENGNGNQVRLGKSSIMQPKVQFKGKGIKWFDDSKLIRKKENQSGVISALRKGKDMKYKLKKFRVMENEKSWWTEKGLTGKADCKVITINLFHNGRENIPSVKESSRESGERNQKQSIESAGYR